MPSIGIDLGTTNSCVAAYRDGTIDAIANDLGFRTTPSCVAFNDQERLIGKAAKDQLSSNHENTVFAVKRLIGRNYNDPTVAENRKLWGFNVVNDNDRPIIQVRHLEKQQKFCAEEISAMILNKMQETAKDFLGDKKICDAVITVPAHFNDSQRKATRDAGAIAGLNVLCMINEPTAAAIAYGLNKTNQSDLNVLVFDFGGGTFDVTILSIKDGIFDVIATGGDTNLGGEDINNRMVNYFSDEFLRKHKVDLRTDKRAVSRLRIACEQAKLNLSVATRSSINVDALFQGIDFSSSITRSKFEDMSKDLFRKTIDTVEETLKNAKMEKHEINDVVLVGGSTRVPATQKSLQLFFEGKKLHKTINPDEAVALGAAAHAAMLSGEDLGIKQFELHDVTPLSLGIRVKGGCMSVVIPRNTKIPAKVTKVFLTTEDDQESVYFAIFEGERPIADDNNLLGEFSLFGVTPAPRNQIEMDVCFEIDASGILYVSAKEKGTDVESNIVISKSGKLSVSEVQRMISDAEKFKEYDELREKRAIEKNELENFAYDTKAAIDGRKHASLYSKKEEDLMLEKCTEVLEWLDINKDELPEMTVLQQKRIDLEVTCKPVIKK